MYVPPPPPPPTARLVFSLLGSPIGRISLMATYQNQQWGPPPQAYPPHNQATAPYPGPTPTYGQPIPQQQPFVSDTKNPYEGDRFKPKKRINDPFFLVFFILQVGMPYFAPLHSHDHTIVHRIRRPFRHRYPVLGSPRGIRRWTRKARVCDWFCSHAEQACFAITWRPLNHDRSLELPSIFSFSLPQLRFSCQRRI